MNAIRELVKLGLGGKRLDLAEEAIVELSQTATVAARVLAEPVLQLAATAVAPDALERSAVE